MQGVSRSLHVTSGSTPSVGGSVDFGAFSGRGSLPEVAESATSATTDEIGAVVRSNRTTTDLDPLGGEHHRVHRSGAGQTTTNEKGTTIMKLTTTTMVTVDGVMQG